MAYTKDSLWKTVDWWTILLYLILITCGWFSVCGASYDYGEPNFLDFTTRAGKQLMWIGCSLGLGFVLLMLEHRLYDTYAYLIDGILLLLLFGTIFNPHEIKGSRSWIVLGPVSLQPAEFAKFATALALAKSVNVPTFHYVSTAYVAGKTVGRVMEDDMPAVDFNNSYEKSKFDAEKLVRESGFAYTIYRPAIVVGRRSDGVVRKPLAFYRLLEFLGQVKRLTCSKAGISPKGPFTTTLRIQAGATDKVYFVPIDYVQETISKLFMFPVENKTYHITGDSPVSRYDIEKAVCEVLQSHGLSVQKVVENPSKQELLVQKMIGDLMPYFESEIIFDQTNVRKALGDKILDWKLDIDFLRKMITAYYKREIPEVVP